MREVLSDLNKTSGITGSMLVGHDGIVIAADLNSQYDDDTIGALAGSISLDRGQEPGATASGAV